MAFLADQDGTIAITSAVAGVVMLAAIGVSVDAARLVGAKQSLQGMADTAALAATRPETMDDTARLRVASEAVADYSRQTSRSLKVDTKGSRVLRGGDAVNVKVRAPVDLIFGGAVGRSVVELSASATAEAVEEANLGVLNSSAISIVIDASGSMGAKDRQGSKLDNVRSAFADVLGGFREGPAAGAVKAGLYPFEWGLVEAKTSSLQPGTDDALDALAYLPTGDGTVPTSALELALTEQVEDRSRDPRSQRYMVYVTDGSVDGDKSDTKGVPIADKDFFGEVAPDECRDLDNDLYEDVIEEQDKLAKRLEDSVRDDTLALPGWDGPLYDKNFHRHVEGDLLSVAHTKREDLLRMSEALVMAQTGYTREALYLRDDDDLEEAVENLLDNDRGERIAMVAKEFRHLHEEQTRLLEVCKPAQETRVIETCEKARDEDITVVAVNLSGDAGEAEPITRECVFGDVEAVLQQETEASRAARDALPPALAALDGLEVAPDGSIYVTVKDRDGLRAVMKGLLPQAGMASEPVRHVRLVK